MRVCLCVPYIELSFTLCVAPYSPEVKGCVCRCLLPTVARSKSVKRGTIKCKVVQTEMKLLVSSNPQSPIGQLSFKSMKQSLIRGFITLVLQDANTIDYAVESWRDMSAGYTTSSSSMYAAATAAGIPEVGHISRRGT